MKDLSQQEKQLSQQLIEESFGLEHIFRELSLIWHFNSIDKEKVVKEKAIDDEEGDEEKSIDKEKAAKDKAIDDE